MDHEVPEVGHIGTFSLCRICFPPESQVQSAYLNLLLTPVSSGLYTDLCILCIQPKALSFATLCSWLLFCVLGPASQAKQRGHRTICSMLLIS